MKIGKKIKIKGEENRVFRSVLRSRRGAKRIYLMMAIAGENMAKNLSRTAASRGQLTRISISYFILVINKARAVI